MKVINARNVNDAYRHGLRLIARDGERTESRNGPVLRMTVPVTTVYTDPTERVLFDRTRNANPFFHLFEALWMLNGGRDVQTMDGFLKSFKQFSDNGLNFHGAYGHRWRHWPRFTPTYTEEIDQIGTAIAMLKKDPTSRRVVISMWDPVRDLATESKDIPCNDTIKLAISKGRLHMVVFNRSNDIVWGCYGANAVHMSVLQEYIAAMIGVAVGTLSQISCDFHAYLETPYNMETFVPPDLWTGMDGEWVNPYRWADNAWALPLVSNVATFDEELNALMTVIRAEQSVRHLAGEEFTNTFFREVAIPMHRAWEHVRRKEYPDAKNVLWEARRSRPDWQIDWLIAGHQWIALRDKE